MYKCILVPTDGSDVTGKAVTTAITLAQALGSRIRTLSAKEPFPYSAISEIQPIAPQEYFEAQERIAQQRVQQVVATCEAAGLTCDAATVEASHPYEAIIEHARQHGCDLIVMASHGRRGMRALLLGSETQKVLTHSSVAVLVVR
ncbi:MAG: universal stress protein [Methylibium sp.]|uniref:universal stress protein n=1 Tax=Methylibium sp. TaxID=2067992 RepID=UPI0018357A5D|nr:universal stress protein [Methylibium sp.]MBA3598677.1 universal stress protein [Methylibium sp.]